MNRRTILILGGAALAAALQSPHCRLTSLLLEGNRLGDAGGVAVAAALQSPHCRLTSLLLSGNELRAATQLFNGYPWVVTG